MILAKKNLGNSHHATVFGAQNEKKTLPNYWITFWNSGHGVYPDSRKRKGFMHKIMTKIIELTKTIMQIMKKQFVTWFIRFCLRKNCDEVLVSLGCLNVKLLNPFDEFCQGFMKQRYYRVYLLREIFCRFSIQFSTIANF